MMWTTTKHPANHDKEVFLQFRITLASQCVHLFWNPEMLHLFAFWVMKQLASLTIPLLVVDSCYYKLAFFCRTLHIALSVSLCRSWPLSVRVQATAAPWSRINVTCAMRRRSSPCSPPLRPCFRGWTCASTTPAWLTASLCLVAAPRGGRTCSM